MVQETPGALPRRAVLAGAASLFGLAPCMAMAQEGSAPVSPLPGSLAIPLGDLDTAAIAAGRNRSSHLTIGVMVNGKGPFSFVVDTGAELTVLSDRLAAELALPQGAPITVEGVTGRIQTRLVPVAELVFGPFRHDNLKLPILPSAFLQADGFLGLDVINGSRVTFDFLRSTLRVERPRMRFEPNGTTATRVRTTGTDGRLRATNCRVDNVRTTAFIDTGAELSVGNPALETALRARRKGVTVMGPATLSDITGTRITGEIIGISEISMQELRFSSGALVIADVPSFDTFGLRNEPAVLIGMDFLRQFASVSIDYRLKQIRFELANMKPPAPIWIQSA